MGKAEDIIAQFKREESKAANFRALYQDAADLMFPQENQINRISFPGEDKTRQLVDTTGAMASNEMASGLSINLVPPGQKFFDLEASVRELNEVEDVKRYLSRTTDTIHERLFGSNFMLQLNETLRSLAVFGTGNIYSEYTTFLNFRDYDIGSYLILENSRRRVDTMLIKFKYTARQAFQEWGGASGTLVAKAMSKDETQNDIFEFIHRVAPRNERNPSLSDNLNMPFESIYIAVKEKIVVDEGGFPEFPYHVARWSKSSNEVFGRGQGTFALPDVRMLQRMKADLIECANKHNNPALEVLEGHEGQIRTMPKGINYVLEQGTIRAIDRGARGNFPITREIVEMQQELVRKAFFNDVFVQLANLKGDRRTTVEIRERIAEGLQRLGPPIGRLQEELFNPLITRVLFLLLRNGQLERPPVQLEGESFKIEYIGRLALELKSHQARGFQQWIGSVAEIATVVPDAIDNIDVDSAVRRLGHTFGVNAEDIATDEEIAAKREARAQQQAAQQALEMAQAMGQGYKDTSKAAEEGSPAQGVMEAIGA